MKNKKKFIFQINYSDGYSNVEFEADSNEPQQIEFKTGEIYKGYYFCKSEHHGSVLFDGAFSFRRKSMLTGCVGIEDVTT